MGADDLNEEKMDELLKLMRAAVPDISDMTDAGKVGFVYKFDYDPAASYEKLDVVKFGMSLWTPKKDTTGNPPPDQSQEGQENAEENEFWVLFLPGALGSDYVKKTDIAKAPTETEAGRPGINFPDGKTITVDENGMLKGAPPGKEMTKEEMDAQIASGELQAGDVVYLKGPAAGEDGLLVKVDSELKDSVNPVQNRVVKEALDRLDALVAETNALRATLESYGLAKISESEAVTDTESGLVLSAKEKNSGIEGTIAYKISKLREETANAYNEIIFKRNKTEASSQSGMENGYAWINNSDAICFVAGNSRINIAKDSTSDAILVRACGASGVFTDWKRIN